MGWLFLLFDLFGLFLIF